MPTEGVITALVDRRNRVAIVRAMTVDGFHVRG